jgi:cytochrome c peroxidase
MMYNRDQAVLPELASAIDWQVLEDPAEVAAISAAAASSPRVDLTTGETAELISFLGSLKDASALTGRLGIPKSVPSGLPIDR